MTAIEAVDLEDADALDLLHRLHALAHDALDTVEQLPPEQRIARGLGQHVLRFVEQPLRLGLDRGADPLGFRGDPRLLGRLLGQQHLDRPAPAGDLGVAHRDDALLRLRGAGFRVLGFRLRGRLFERLLIERDRFLHQRRLDDPLALDLEPAQVALACDARFVDAAIGGDAGALDLLAGGDLGLLQRLHARDLELLDRAPSLEARRVQRLLALDVAPLDLLRGDDFGLPHLTIGVDALGLLGRQRDRAVLVGDLDRLLLLDVEHFARPLRGDAIGLERELDADALALDGVAAPELRRLDRLGPGDLEASRLLLGLDALGRDRLLLRDARGFDRLARLDLRFSIAWVRAISRARISSSLAMRSAWIFRS